VESFDELDELLPDLNQLIAGMKVPRQSHRYSGRTAMKANVNVHEPKQAEDTDSVLAFSMEGISPLKDATILGASWSPGWNSNQSISKFQDEVNGKLKQDHCGELLLERNKEGDYLSPLAGAESDGESDGKNDDEGLELNLAFQIFGSEELSARADAIGQRMTDAYISLSPVDAKALGIRHGQRVRLNGNGAFAAACIREQMREGTVAVYCGDSLNPHELPARLQPEPASSAAEGRGLGALIVSDLMEEG
jgi:NADH-quinone oxidoreductase subunit G